MSDQVSPTRTLWGKMTLAYERCRPGGAVIGGNDVVVLSSNDYLGLACDSRVIRAAMEATERYGAGARAARSLGGDTAAHRTLEEELADFKGQRSVLTFASGFACNYGVLTAMMRSGGRIVSDALNHASIVDGARASRAAVRVYDHRNVESLWRILGEGDAGPTVVVTDGVFSMEGVTAPLAEIVRVAQLHAARVVVDDAHGTGVYGDGGRGTVSAHGVEGAVALQTGTLGKALGSIGGFVAGGDDDVAEVAEYARTFLFTTSTPPAAAAASLQALRILRREPELVDRLWSNARELHHTFVELGLAVPLSPTPIIPVTFTAEHDARRFAAELLRFGVAVQAVGPPYVAAGSSRLRVIASAGHTPQDLRRIATAFGAIVARRGYAQPAADSAR